MGIDLWHGIPQSITLWALSPGVMARGGCYNSCSSLMVLAAGIFRDKQTCIFLHLRVWNDHLLWHPILRTGGRRSLYRFGISPGFNDGNPFYTNAHCEKRCARAVNVYRSFTNAGQCQHYLGCCRPNHRVIKAQRRNIHCHIIF